MQKQGDKLQVSERMQRNIEFGSNKHTNKSFIKTALC